MTSPRERLRGSWPLVVLLLVVLAGAIRWTGESARDGWRDAQDDRLAAAGAGTNAAMLDTEREQLEALRAFTFTVGLPEALQRVDVGSIEELLEPVDANLATPMVDVLDTSGRVVFAFRAEGELPPIYRERTDLGIVQRALRGEPDDFGDRFSTLVVSDEGALIASAGPVRLGDEVVGALLVLTPLDHVLTRAATKHGGIVTVYSGDGGVPLATTAPVKPRALPYDRLLPTDELPASSGYAVPGGRVREQLGALIVRHEAVAWLGVADRDGSGGVARRVSLATAVGLLACTALTALLVRRMSAPARRRDDVDPAREPAGALPAREPDPVPMSPAGRTRW